MAERSPTHRLYTSEADGGEVAYPPVVHLRRRGGGGRRRIAGLGERRRVARGALNQVDEVGHEAEHDREAEEAAEAAEADEGRLRARLHAQQLDLELHRVLAALDGERGVRR